MRFRYEPHEVDGDGIPWTDEPVPELDPGVADHFARKRCFYRTANGDERIVFPHQGVQLVRHIGRRGGIGQPRGGDEWLPVRLVEGQYPLATHHEKADRVRGILGGGGTVRSTTPGRDFFDLRHAEPRSPLDEGERRRSPDQITRGAGPAEIVYVYRGGRWW
jgi:hypothetical protein